MHRICPFFFFHVLDYTYNAFLKAMGDCTFMSTFWLQQTSWEASQLFHQSNEKKTRTVILCQRPHVDIYSAEHMSPFIELWEQSLLLLAKWHRTACIPTHWEVYKRHKKGTICDPHLLRVPCGMLQIGKFFN